MPKREYPFDYKSSESVEIIWEGSSFYPDKDIRVVYSGKTIATFFGRSDLAVGRKFLLPDKTQLSVKLENNEIQVYRDGQSLSEIANVLHDFRVSWQMLAFSGIISLILSLWVMVRDSSFNLDVNSANIYLLGGILSLGISFWASKKSKVAYLVGALIYAIQMLLSQAIEGQFQLALILPVVLIAFYCIRGFQSIQKMSH